MRERPGAWSLAWLVGVAGALVMLIATGCGDGQSGLKPTSATHLKAARAQARVDAFAEVARRIYAHEHAPVVARKAIKRLETNLPLIRALESGNHRRIRALARQPVLGHEVRVRVVHGSNVLMDAGLPNVVQAAEGELRAPDGTALGTVQVSVQDLIGFVKLVDRETGTRMVVRGQNGSVETMFPAAAHARLPATGKVEIRGHTYLVRRFAEADFVGKRLTVWMLDPA
jgi:hypothetical protein